MRVKLYEPRFWRWLRRNPPTIQGLPDVAPETIPLPEVRPFEAEPEADNREVIIDRVIRHFDDVEVEGTVDGVFATVHCWYSHLVTLDSDAAQQSYLRSILREATPIHERLYHLEDHEPS